jgi:DNA mismatch repair protein MutS
VAPFTSVLFPQGDALAGFEAVPDCFPDLHLDEIVAAVTTGTDNDYLKKFFNAPLRDISAVQYRHRVFRDLERQETRKPIQKFVENMRTIRREIGRADKMWHPLQRQGWLAHAVDAYCRTTTQLRDDLTDVQLSSPGLQGFSGHLADYADSDTFRKLAADTAALHTRLHGIRYTVHIHGLRVHVEKFNDQSDYSVGVINTFERFATEVRDDYRVAFKNFPDMNHVEEQILECVAKLHPETFDLLADYCDRNQNFIEPTVGRFEHEVRFYLAYLDFIARFSAAGLSFAYPELTAQPGALSVEDGYDLALAIKSFADDEPVVRNDFRLSGAERILVVTGPNQGGKTTFARAIGQCAYLASLGCPIPAKRASVMLPDHICTHFERQESLSTLHGKLDDELVRIHDILSRASAASIIVMNESFSSTTVNDALLIGTEVLERIIELNCAAVYVSFLDELANLSPACVSMVGEVAPDDPTQRTFRFTRRPADGLAYAAALADKYGLNHDVLRQRVSR